MFLRNLRIENIRGVDKVELSFENGSNGGIRPWTVFLGVNGSSKSTILRSVALALAGSDALPALLADVDSWIRLGATRGRIEAVVQTAEGDKRELRLELRKGDGISAVLRRNEEGLSLLDRAIARAPRNYFIAGYGASRRLSLDPELAFKARSKRNGYSRADALGTLFSPDATLNPLQTWAIDLHYRQGEKGIKMIREALESLMPDMDFHGINKETKELLFHTYDGVIPLEQLSDGYQNVAAWCGDLLHRGLRKLHQPSPGAGPIVDRRDRPPSTSPMAT